MFNKKLNANLETSSIEKLKATVMSLHIKNAEAVLKCCFLNQKLLT